jgi:NTE family protein
MVDRIPHPHERRHQVLHGITGCRVVLMSARAQGRDDEFLLPGPPPVQSAESDARTLRDVLHPERLVPLLRQERDSRCESGLVDVLITGPTFLDHDHEGYDNHAFWKCWLSKGSILVSTSDLSRALVLGGGGITGIGWEVGVLAGLLDEGIDLRTADTVIGTSAGSFVGTNFTSAVDWETVFSQQEHAAEHEPAIRTDPAVFAAWQDAFRAGGGDPRKVGASFGAISRAFPSPVDPAARLHAIEARLLTNTWPENMHIVTTDSLTGELRLLSADSGIPITTATSASGAVPGIWPSVTIDGRDYVDGGMVSAANAYLAAGHDVTVVLAPMPSGFAGIPSVQDDVDQLNETATAILAVPDDASRTAIGANPYDATRAAAAAEAGRQQGRVFATRLRGIW